jgi:uncharacterized protein YndB with AHSA1/START domain
MTVPMLDRITRDVAASPDAACAAFLDADALVAWLPPDGMTGELDDADLREGGGFTMTLTYDEPTGAGKTTAESDVTRVAIVEVEKDRKVVWSVGFESDDPDYDGRMTMTWTFAALDGGTRVAVDVTDVPPGIDPDVHAQGIKASLANLARHVEG